jgi:Phage integrase, N-terminal SAM-like domain
VLVVPLTGSLLETGDRWEPFRLIDPAGDLVAAAAEFFVDLQARGRSQATVRSYGMDLLRWFRFCWAIGARWDRVTRTEARDFCRWMLVAGKPARSHWRARRQSAPARAAGLTYLQHIIAVHAVIDGSQLRPPAGPLPGEPRPAAHTDLLLYAR